MLGDAGAAGVAHRIDPEFYPVDEAEVGLEEGASQVLVSHLLSHNGDYYYVVSRAEGMRKWWYWAWVRPWIFLFVFK